MAMTKSNIVDAVHKKVGFPKSQVAEAVDTVLETMKQVLERGEKLKISGFGNFTPRDKKTRVGRNPKTGAAIEISARRVVTFRCSGKLRDKVNGG